MTQKCFACIKTVTNVDIWREHHACCQRRHVKCREVPDTQRWDPDIHNSRKICPRRSEPSIHQCLQFSAAATTLHHRIRAETGLFESHAATCLSVRQVKLTPQTGISDQESKRYQGRTSPRRSPEINQPGEHSNLSHVSRTSGLALVWRYTEGLRDTAD